MIHQESAQDKSQQALIQARGTPPSSKADSLMQTQQDLIQTSHKTTFLLKAPSELPSKIKIPIKTISKAIGEIMRRATEVYKLRI